MKICINGLGNIGTTLALILNDYKTELGISEIIGFKNNVFPWQTADLDFLRQRGIKVVNASDTNLDTVLRQVDVVFDTMSNGFGLKNKVLYQQFEHLRSIAQGSEKGFGLPYMTGVGQDVKNEKFVQIVSCNTHGATCLLQLFSGKQLKNLDSADFVVVRRSEDLGESRTPG